MQALDVHSRFMMDDAEKLYMQSPLVRWVDTFKANDGHTLEYRDLYDGVFLNDVMQQIDPRLAYDGVNRCVGDVTARLHNWDLLVKNIQGFYRDVLQQLLVIRLPNISAICREPGKDSSFAEVRRALLLILGCAVQCEHKEHFIDKIMVLDITAQTEIVDNIKEMTDDCKTILPIQRPQSPTSSASFMDKMFQHLNRLIQERDDFVELAADVGQERDYYMSQAEGKPVIDSPQKSPDKHHVALELAECKAKLRHLRQELEDRQEQLLDLKDELQESLLTCSELKNKNEALLQEARGTRLLRDELDIMKEKAMKVDVFEKELLKYKEKLNELEFYKARTEEMKEDNSILEETKAMLEDQLASSRKRIETVVELELQLEKYRGQIDELTMDRESDRAKLEFLTEENARLQFEKKSSMNESVSLETELSVAKSRIGNVGSSLSEQLSETSHTRILRLELENQRLTAKLAEMKEAALIHSAEVSLELEKENQRLAKKVEKLQSSLSESSEQLIRLESELSLTKEDRDRFRKSVDALSEKSDHQVQELEKENEQLSQTLHQIRERIEKTSDLKVKDLEKENKHLHKAVSIKNSQLNKLEFNNRQLQRSCHQVQENAHRVQELEHENQVLEKENTDLHQKMATAQHAANKLEAIEQENSDLSVENHKLHRTVENLQKMAQRREQEEQDHISLTLEHQRLQRTLESLRSESDRAVELETEKNDLSKELQQLRKLLEGQKTQKLKQEQLEIEILNSGNENQRLQKSIEVMARQLQQLEKDSSAMEADKEQISKELETLRITAKRLEKKDTEASQLESELLRLQKDKASLEKDNKKLKQILDVKDSSLEEINTKLLSLTQELKSQRQTVEKMKETCSKVKDIEKESKELLQELNTDRRTLANLREDLVNEKIRSQDLSNELEQLTNELEKVGIDTQKLTAAEQTKDANRYKALEMMIEETLKKSSELKEKKIMTLESKLDESKSRNLKLQEELRTAKRESDSLKQRLEEELEGKVVFDGRRVEKDKSVKSGSPNMTKEIFQLKDHLVELERQNATLLAETDNLRSNNQNVTEQCCKLDTQLSNLHSQHATLQGHYSSLQEQNAKLQVAHTTIQSQTSSILSQQDRLKDQLSSLEAEYESLTHKYEGLQSTHQSFVSDHESLQHLHQQLTSEYESLIAEHGSLKSLHKSLKGELKDLQDQHKVLLQDKDDVNKLREVIDRERDQLKRELMSLGSLKTDHQQLRESHHQLRSAFDKLSKDYSNVLASHKQIKTDYNTLQLKTTELQGELSEAKENLSVADMECQKLENRMEAVYQINERIDNENQSLLMQIQQLLNQNHELLMKALNSKDHFAEEEKAYLEKLSELRRQKERLEEKIMEHYKNRISPKKKGLGALIARKARGIMSKGTRRSKSRNNLSEMADSSSQGVASPEQSSSASHTLGAKSTEDISKSASTDGGFLQGDGQRPGGQRSTTPGLGKKIQGRSSQDNELLTLNQFLMEANNAADSNVSDDSCADELRQHGHAPQQFSSDSESRKSDHSNNSGGPSHQQYHPELRNGRATFRQDIPNVSANSMMSPVTRELSSSKISHNSTESGSESSCFDLDGVLPGDAFTSTPKADSKTSHSNYNGHTTSFRMGAGIREHQQTTSTSNQHHQIGNTSNQNLQSVIAANQHYQSANVPNQNIADNHLSGNPSRKLNMEHSSPVTSTRITMSQQPSPLPRNLGSQTSASISQAVPDHQSQQQYSSSHLPNRPMNNSTSNIRKPPTEPPPAVPITERPLLLDNSSSALYAKPFVNSSAASGQLDHHFSSDSRNPRDVDRDNQPISSPRLESRGPQGTVDRTSGGPPGQLQQPLTQPQQRPPSSNQSQNLDNSVVSGHMPRRPPPNPHQRARPASVMGPSPHIRGVYSRPPGEDRPRQQLNQSRSTGQTENTFSSGLTGQVQVSSKNASIEQNNRPRMAERSKSVPPQFFNKTDDFDDDSRRDMPDCPVNNTRSEKEIFIGERGIQMPDGQDHRASQSFSNISLIREPSRGRSISRSATPSQESPSYRQSHPQQPVSHPQQQEHPISGSQVPINSNMLHSMRQPAQMINPQQELSHTLQSQSTRYLSGNRAGSLPSTVCHPASSRPDFLPLTQHEQHITRPEHHTSRQNYDPGRQNYDPGTVPHNQSPVIPRSHSSTGNSLGSSPSGILPGPSYARGISPSGISPGPSYARGNSPSGISPGLPYGRNSLPSSNFSPGATYGRISTPAFHPGKQGFPPNQLARNIQEGASCPHDITSYGSEHPNGQYSNYSTDQYSAGRALQAPLGSSEPRENPTAHPDSYNPAQKQPLTPSSSIYSSSANPPPPPRRSSSRDLPSYRRSGSPSDYISNGPSEHHYPTSQQHVASPQTRSQGRPQSSYHPSSVRPQQHPQGHLIQADQTMSPSSFHPSSVRLQQHPLGQLIQADQSSPSSLHPSSVRPQQHPQGQLIQADQSSPSPLHPSSVRPQQHPQGQLIQADQMMSPSSLHPNMPQSSPQLKTAPQTPSASEQEMEGEQPKPKSSVWSHRWS